MTRRGATNTLATLSYVFIGVAVVALMIWATSAGNPAAPDTAASPGASATPAPSPLRDAEPLLLPLDEIKTITGNPELSEAGTNVAPGLPPPQVAVFEPADCFPSMGAGAPQPYEDSGYRTYYAKNFIQRPTPSMQVDQAVTIFDDAAAAQKALSNYIELWQRCAGQRLMWTHVVQGEVSMWTLGAPQEAGGGIATLRSVNDASPVSVTRAIGTRANVVVDIWILGSGVSDQAATIAQRITAG
jgi:eukaryotic-like serine/threonine-protein kinase